MACWHICRTFTGSRLGEDVNHGEIFHPHISTVTLYHVNPYPATGQFYKILLILLKILVIILLVYL